MMSEPQASEAVEPVARAIAEPILREFDAWPDDMAVDWEGLPHRSDKDSIRGIAAAAIAAVEASLRPMIEAEVAAWLWAHPDGTYYLSPLAEAIERGDHRTKGRDDGR